MSEYPKVVRLPVKPREMSGVEKMSRKIVDDDYRRCEEDENPFVNVAAVMEGMCQQIMRERRERERGFVLDNSHRRHMG